MLLPRKIRGFIKGIRRSKGIYGINEHQRENQTQLYLYLWFSRLPITNNIHQNIRPLKKKIMINNILFLSFSDFSAHKINNYLLSLVKEIYR